jgi:hypothetical protein
MFQGLSILLDYAARVKSLLVTQQVLAAIVHPRVPELIAQFDGFSRCRIAIRLTPRIRLS